MKPTREQLRQLDRDNSTYPEELAEVPAASWPEGLPDQRGIRLKVWRSRQFLVQVFGEGRVIRLSANRTEWDHKEKSWRADISWDDLQRLKNEAGYGEQCAVELYPPDSDVVNVANMRHLFLLDAPPFFMWRS
jgi:hypothetical protein